MSAPSQSGGQPIEDRHQLVAYFEQGCKPPEDWRLGTEHEKFLFRLDDRKPLPYEGDAGVGAFLQALTRFGWEPIRENDNIVALRMGRCHVTLEPGGQLELAGAPVTTIHEACAEVQEHLAQVKSVAHTLGVGLIGLGFAPTWRREDMSWMPKQRYEIMRRYMPTRGDLGLDMMLRTATVQVNLDYASETDMVKKLRVGLALQPIATALFANSPFTEGKPNGFLSYRSHIWTDTDPDRCGTLPWVFESGMGFERYADYALDVPMYFVYREGRYIDAAGQSFRDFLDGKLPALPGERPTLGDWDDHLTTLFPEVRLKRFMEMRGADGGPWRRLCALPALWAGLCYDETALDAAWDLVKDWTEEERAQMRLDVPRTGLDTPFRDTTAGELARRVLAIAREGLTRRDCRDGIGRDESRFLDQLDGIAASGRCEAQIMLEAYEGRWRGRIEPVFEEYAY